MNEMSAARRGGAQRYSLTLGARLALVGVPVETIGDYSTFFVLPGTRMIPLSASPAERARLEAYNARVAEAYEMPIQVSRFTWGLGGPAPGHEVFTVTLAEGLRSVYYADEDAKNRALHESKGFFDALIDAFGDVLKVVGAYYFGSAKLLAPVLSYIPGIGTVAAAITTAVASLALGDGIDEALIASVRAALPGAPVSQAAFDAARDVLTGIAKGERFDAILMKGARDMALSKVPADLSPVLRKAAETAIDTAIVLAQGEDLQAAGFSALHNLARGNTLAEQAADFGEKVATSARTGIPVADLLNDQIRGNLAAAVPASAQEGELRPVLERLASDPALRKLSPAELADRESVDESVAHAALSTVRELPIPKWMLDKLGIVGPVTFVDEDQARAVLPIRATNALRVRVPEPIRATNARRIIVEAPDPTLTRLGLPKRDPSLTPLGFRRTTPAIETRGSTPTSSTSSARLSYALGALAIAGAALLVLSGLNRKR